MADSPKGAYKENRKPLFLAAFRRLGTKLRASQAAGINRDTVDEWIRKDANFALEFKKADQVVTEDLEDTAIEKAKAGDNALLIFLLKRRNPAKYTERFRYEIDSTALGRLIGAITSVLKRTIPEKCPHCKTLLEIKPRLAKELLEVSANWNEQSIPAGVGDE